MSTKQLTGKHQYREFKEETIVDRVRKMVELRDQVDVENAHIKLSYGNRKTGSLVPSISLIPVADCGNCKVCSKGCYAVRNVACYIQSRAMMAQNSAIAHNDLWKYFREVSAASMFLRFFRYHVAGDILSPDYLKGMVEVAIRNPHCQYLAFTKCFDIVNNYLDNYGSFPENLHIIFSEWRGLDVPNPHNLPTSRPIWNGEKIDGYLCKGNCSECAAFNCGCWTLKKGERVLFEAH